MNRLEVLHQIDKLCEELETADKDREKEIDKELAKLGKMLKIPRRENKLKSLLKKGKDLTHKEIKYLISQDILKKDIAKAMGISQDNFTEIMNFYENGGKVVRKARGAKAKGDTDKAKKLLKETDMRPPQISKETGVNVSTVYTYARAIRGKAKKKENKPKEAEKMTKENIEPITQDNVNSPGHYTDGDIEVIDYIKDKLTPEQFVGYCIGNVMKYTSRYRLKGGSEDLEKAQKYLSWAAETYRQIEQGAV